MRRLMFITVAAFLFSLSLSAQTVDEIIAKGIEARGGLAKIKAVQTIRITGNAEFGGMQAGFVQLHKRADKMRSDISILGLTMVRAYDGQTGWQIVPFTGKKDPELMADDDLKAAREEADIDGPLTDYKQKGHKVELIGKEKTEATDAYHIRVTLKNGGVRDLFFDAGSFLATKAIVRVTRQGTETVVESTMGDYKEVQGLMIPFSIAQHQQGGQGPEQKIIIEKVEINVPIDDAQFKMPTVPEKTGPPPAASEHQSTKPN